MSDKLLKRGDWLVEVGVTHEPLLLRHRFVGLKNLPDQAAVRSRHTLASASRADCIETASPWRATGGPQCIASKLGEGFYLLRIT